MMTIIMIIGRERKTKENEDVLKTWTDGDGKKFKFTAWLDIGRADADAATSM